MEVYPVDYVNDPYVIGRNDRVVSINAFLQVSLDGEVNSETVNGKQYSAPGGQLDFVRGAQLSREGKSILAAYSTAVGGTVSRIVPQIEGPATDPRADTQYIVTEYGVAICAENRARKGRKDLSPSRIPISGMRFAKEPESSATYRGTLCEKQARHLGNLTRKSRGLIRSSQSKLRPGRQESPGRTQDSSTEGADRMCALRGPCFCARPGAIDHKLTEELLERRRWGFCPACDQVSRQEGQGRLIIRGTGLAANRALIRSRIENVARQAMATQPERRIVSI